MADTEIKPADYKCIDPRVQAFAVVKTLYTNLEGERVPGLFVVIYTDKKDDNVMYSQNCVGLKITSKPVFMDKYFYRLSSRKYPFLDKESWVQCSKPNVLDLSQCTTIGHLDVGTRMALYRTLKMFLGRVDNQMLDNMPVAGVVVDDVDH